MSHFRTLAFTLALSLAASCGPPAQAPEAPAGHGASGHDESPESAGDENASFGLRLALLEGHLMIARELLDNGQQENSIPHFGHPVRELYGDIRPVIQARGGEQIEGDLIRAESLAVLNGESPEFAAAYDAALLKTRAARALIPADVWNNDEYQLRLVADIASIAAQEYRNALVGGRIDSLIEYHDTRGFMFYAADLLASRQSSDPRIAQAARIVGELKALVEPLNPPNPPRADDATFTAKVAELRALLGG